MARKYPNLRVPGYRFHAASGRGVIQYRPLWGKNPRYLAGQYESRESLADYEKCCDKVATHQMRKKAGKLKFKSAGVDIAVAKFLRRYFAWAQVHYGIKSRDFSHLARAAHPLRERYGRRALCTIGPLRLKKVRDDMVAAGWSRTHVNAQFRRLRSIFKWGVENELVKARHLEALQAIQPLKQGKTTAPEKPKVRPIAWSVASQVLPYVTPTVATMIEVQYLTAMRSSELCTMRIIDIDFQEHVWIYWPEDHKNKHRGKLKPICLGPCAQALLIPYLQVPADQFLFGPRTATRERNSLRRAVAKNKQYGKKVGSRFRPTLFRERYFNDTYRKAIGYGFEKLEGVLQAAGTVKLPERWHPHRLRHTRATSTRELYGREGAEAQLGNTAEAAEIYAEKSLPLAIRIALETG